jgi:hypothetical protein
MPFKCILAWERHQHRPEIFRIFENSKGIMFYSVPHKGSSLADFTLPLLRRSVELIEIQRSMHNYELRLVILTKTVTDCDFVLDLHKRFLQLCKNEQLKADVFSFIETSFTLMSFVYLKIVAYESAGNSCFDFFSFTFRFMPSVSDPDIGVKCDVPLDHREICKPAGRDCFLYVELMKLIKKHFQ